MARRKRELVVVATHHYVKDPAQAELALQMWERYLAANLGQALKHLTPPHHSRTSA